MTTYSAVLPTYSAAATQNVKDAMTSVATLMTNAGFAKSTESGELDIDAVVFASTGNYGFQVWYLNDSMHAAYPIYIRLYWKMSASNQLGLAYTIGHASDGAGNITGYKVGSDSTYLNSGSTSAWGITGNASKACSLNGYGYWALCPSTSAGAVHVSFLLSREWDPATGAIANNGNYTLTFKQSSSLQGAISVNRADSLYYATAAGQLGFVPGFKNASLQGAYTDIFKTYHVYPSRGYKTSGALCLYNTVELSQWSTFSANVLGGGSARTWLATNNTMFVTTSDQEHAAAVLWE